MPLLTDAQKVLLLAFGNSASALLTTDEINFFISSEHNLYMAAAACLEASARKSTGNVRSKTIGALSITYADAEDFRKRAAMLRARGSAHQVMSVGGLSEAERDSYAEDTDLVQPYFSTEMHRNQSTPAETTEE